MTAPWGLTVTPEGQLIPRADPSTSAMGFPQYPQLGLLAPANQGYGAPPMFAPKPSIVDRVLGRLFPSAQYAGLLDPGAQRGLQQQGLLGLGASLLQAGGPAPYQRGTLANLGGALQQSQQGFPQMAERALQLQAYRGQLAQQQAIAQASAAHPAQPNESQDDTYRRLAAIITDVSTIPGGDAIAGKLAPVLAALKPSTGEQTVTKLEHVVDTQLGSPTVGMTGTLTLQGGKRIRFDPESAQGKYHVEKNTETGAAYYVPDTPAGGKPVPVGLNLGGRSTASQAALTGAESRAAAQRLLTAQLDGQQLVATNPGAAQPSTLAAAAGGIVQKIAGERAGTGVTTALRGSQTNQYQQAAGRWVDAYMQLVPKSRSSSRDLRDTVLRTYWGQEGDDPASIAAKETARRVATAALARAVATGTAPALPGFEPEAAVP
jgi:hypothetical protein